MSLTWGYPPGKYSPKVSWVGWLSIDSGGDHRACVEHRRLNPINLKPVAKWHVEPDVRCPVARSPLAALPKAL